MHFYGFIAETNILNRKKMILNHLFILFSPSTVTLLLTCRSHFCSRRLNCRHRRFLARCGPERGGRDQVGPDNPGRGGDPSDSPPPPPLAPTLKTPNSSSPSHTHDLSLTPVAVVTVSSNVSHLAYLRCLFRSLLLFFLASVCRPRL